MTRALKRLRPIREHEGLSWEAFLEAVVEPPTRTAEPVPLSFTEAPPLAGREHPTEGCARAPPPFATRPETLHPHYR